MFKFNPLNGSIEKIILENNIIEKSYIDLKLDLLQNKLIPGQIYKIIDFELIYTVFGTNDEVRSSGVVEPLLVRAISKNKLEQNARSLLYENDIIIYDITPYQTFNNQTYTFHDIPNSKGKILYREDIINHISAYYDWRHEEFKRYEILDNNGKLTEIEQTILFRRPNLNDQNPIVHYVKTFPFLGNQNSYYKNIFIGSNSKNIVFHNQSGIFDVLIEHDVIDCDIYASQVIKISHSNGDLTIGNSHHINLGCCIDGTIIEHNCSDIIVDDGIVLTVPSFTVKAHFSNFSEVKDITYHNLLSLIRENKLIPEQKYKIIDFRIYHKIPNSEENNAPPFYNFGEIEPLIVKAQSKNSLYEEAKSTLYPDDIIHYDIFRRDPYRILNDDSDPNFRGWITRREDPIRNIKAYFDFRNVKSRVYRSLDNPNVFFHFIVNGKFNINLNDYKDVNVFSNGGVNIELEPDPYQNIPQIAFLDFAEKIKVGFSTYGICINGTAQDVSITSCSLVQVGGNIENVSMHDSSTLLSIGDIFNSTIFISFVKCLKEIKNSFFFNEEINSNESILNYHSFVKENRLEQIIQDFSLIENHRHLPEEVGAEPKKTFEIVKITNEKCFCGTERFFTFNSRLVTEFKNWLYSITPVSGNTGGFIKVWNINYNYTINQIVLNKNDNKVYRCIRYTSGVELNNTTHWEYLGELVRPTSFFLDGIDTIKYEWESLNYYFSDFIVFYNNSFYYALQENSGIVPDSDPQVWAKLPIKIENSEDLKFGRPFIWNGTEFVYKINGKDLDISNFILFPNVFRITNKNKDIIKIKDQSDYGLNIFVFMLNFGEKTIKGCSSNNPLKYVFRLPTLDELNYFYDEERGLPEFYGFASIFNRPAWMLETNYWSNTSDSTEDTYYFEKELNQIIIKSPSIGNLGSDVHGIVIKPEYAQRFSEDPNSPYSGITEASLIPSKWWDDFKKVLGRFVDSRYLNPEIADDFHIHDFNKLKNIPSEFNPKFHLHREYLTELPKDEIINIIKEENEMLLTKIVDEVNENLMFIGEAKPGTLTNESRWRIKRIEFLNNDVIMKWANGNPEFENIWDNRLNLNYF